MAITWLVESPPRKVGRHKIIRALLRDNGTIKRAEVMIAHDATLTMDDVQSAWNAADVLPNGLDEWSALQLRETDALYDKVVRAILNQLRDGGGVAEGGTLAQITNAGKAALAPNTLQTQALTRLTNLFKAATPAQQADFLMLMVLVTNSKLGKR
jgi:hypothetical protein